MYLKTYLSNTPNTVDQIQIQIQIHGLKFDQIQIQIQIRRICICICICKYKYVFDPSPGWYLGFYKNVNYWSFCIGMFKSRCDRFYPFNVFSLNILKHISNLNHICAFWSHGYINWPKSLVIQNEMCTKIYHKIWIVYSQSRKASNENIAFKKKIITFANIEHQCSCNFCWWTWALFTNTICLRLCHG